MEELPEKNSPESRPEDETPKAESPRTPDPVEISPPQAERDNGAPGKEKAAGSEPVQASEERPEVDHTSEREKPAVNEKPGEALGSDAEPAAAIEAVEAAGEPSAALTKPESSENEVEVTPSGAIKMPAAEGETSAEARAHEEARPRRPAARPERPTGPRLAELRPGQLVDGTVTRIEKYGAFVNLGLVERRDGLIHISELTEGRVRRVEDVVQVGSPVRARVVAVDLGRGRVALSLNDVDEGIAKEASAGPSEPPMTSMAMAFQAAQGRRSETEERLQSGSGDRDKGGRKKREQEELMRRLRTSNE